jgi:hypothetical protein
LGDELFGFYKNIANKPEWKKDWDRFLFKGYLGRDFAHVRMTGLTGQEGNRRISLEMKNEQGAGLSGSEWRRLAKLIVFVPKCRGVGVRGALAGFKVEGLASPLIALGEGDRDYETSYEVAHLRGSLSTDNIPIHRLEGIVGDVSINGTAYTGNVSTAHDDRGVTIEPGEIRTSLYRDIQGDLRIRFVRTDLSLEAIAGRLDVENDFGRTVWTVDRPVARKDHRLVSQSGTIEVRLGKAALGDLGLSLYTECGIVHLAPGMNNGLEDSSFHAASADGVSRSWHGFVSKRPRDANAMIERFDRVSGALLGRPRTPGVDILNRGGSISLTASRPG